MRKLLRFALDLIVLLACLLLLPFLSDAQSVTLVGTLQASNGLPASNFNISFTPTQWFYVAGTGVTINSTTFCGTSVDGSVHQFPNPLQPSIVTPAFTGTLPASNYYVEYAFYTAGGTTTLVSPETVADLSSTGELQIAPPASGLPAGAAGMKVYVGATSGSETLQGTTTGSAVYLQNIPLVSGAAVPSSNNTICTQIANDAGWPTGTGYVVSLTDPSGNTYPGYPMTWQLLGPNTTINLSSGLPYYHGVVTYPVPILAVPQNHAAQSISGPLSLTGYNLVNVGALGVGTGLPAWGVDVEGAALLGIVNAKGGYLVNGTAGTTGQALCSDGSAYDTACTVLTGPVYYQTVINGSHATDAVTQRAFLAVGTGTGLVASDDIGVGSQVSRTSLNLNVIGGEGTLGADNFAVVTAAGGTNGHVAVWDATTGGLADGGTYTPTPFTGTSGWQIMPSGLIFEWGTTPTFDTGPQTVSFPHTFPHAVFNVVISDCSNDGGECSGSSDTSRIWLAGGFTTSQFAARNDGNGAGFWQAIGW